MPVISSAALLKQVIRHFESTVNTPSLMLWITASNLSGDGADKKEADSEARVFFICELSQPRGWCRPWDFKGIGVREDRGREKRTESEPRFLNRRQPGDRFLATKPNSP